MAGSSFSTLGDMLEEDYLGVIEDQLNEDVFMWERMEKATWTRDGLDAIVPLKVARNSGVAFTGGNFPVPGAQQIKRMVITSKKLYGSISIPGDLLASAEQGSKHAYVSAVDLEMEGIKDDIARFANTAVFSGGPLCGFLNEHKSSTAGDWQFSGNLDKLAALVAAGGSPTVSLIRADTYATLAATVTVNSVNVAAGTVSLGGAVNTTGVAAGFAISVLIDGGDAAFMANLALEPTGVYGNLALPAHFTIDRTTATGYPAVQSSIVTAKQTGDHARQDLSVANIAGALSTIVRKASTKVRPNVIVCSPEQLNKYQAVVQAQLRTNLSGDDKKSAKTLDGGPLSVSYAEIPLVGDIGCALGMLIFYREDSWKKVELRKGSFKQIDGLTWRQVILLTGPTAGPQDEWAAAYSAYWDIICKRPNANLILVGLTY